MALYNRGQVVTRAMAATKNTPGTCQLWTRTIIGAPSAGDRDGDGDADAVDGWLSEPAKYRHSDRNPPAGVPVAFKGGSHGYGHRAISLGNGLIRSTDMAVNAYSAGRIGTTTIAAIEKHMGVTYVGWSESMDGYLIPLVLEVKPVRPATPTAPLVSPRAVPGKWAKFAHLSPYAKNNSVMGLLAAKKLRYTAIDLDFQVTKDGVLINTHWGDTREFKGPRRKFADMTWREVSKLRAKKGGYRIRTAAAMLALAKKHGFTRVEFEAKGSHGFEGPAGVRRFKRVKARAESLGIDVEVKTLSNIGRSVKRLAAAHEAGLTTIVLPRGARRLKKADYWPVTDFARGPVKWV